MMEANKESLIDGSWYEEQYSSENSDYRKMYITNETPPISDATQKFTVDFALAVTQIKGGSNVLDLGCGTGFYLKYFLSKGLTGSGLEVSQTAVDASGIDTITQGCMPDGLSIYKDDEFDLSFSSDVLEHIHESKMDKTISEIMRVSKISCHYIAHEKGVDPGHITIKTPREWLFYLKSNHSSYDSFMINNPISPKYPLFVICKKHTPLTIQNMIINGYA